MTTNAQLRAQAKYDKNNTKQIVLKLNLGSDADILAKLSDESNKQGYLKKLIREDIKGDTAILSIDAIRYLIKPIARKYGCKKIYLFGSYARGEATAESDVDLLIEGGEFDTLSKIMNAEEAFEKAFDRKVDVVVGRNIKSNTDTRAGKRFLRHFERDKVLIYEAV